MSQNLSKNEIAWIEIFDKYNVLEEIRRTGRFQIKASIIKSHNREPRLMTKFDHSIQLPKIFRENHLSIQPDSRGTYIIGAFESYHKLEESETIEVENISFPNHIQSLNPFNIYSESSALICADISGMMSQILCEEVELTILGRMSTGQFSYSIRNKVNGKLENIDVSNSQCEIDAGFEGPTKLAIVEAKSESVNDFMVRQLYYPYRKWAGKVNKTIVPIFLIYSNEIFTFYVYKFSNESEYSSLELVECRKIRIVPNEITMDDIGMIMEKSIVAPEPDEPFPQADNIERLIDLLGKLVNPASPVTRDFITENYAFDIRQTGYYTSAGKYLGLIRQETTNREIEYKLTNNGERIMSLHPNQRNLELAQTILTHGPFNSCLRSYFCLTRRPTISEIVPMMTAHGVDYSLNTLQRRAQTVQGWINWIIGLPND